MPASAFALVAAAVVFRAAAPVPVCHNGFLILRVRTAAWGLSAERRAVIVQQRFSKLIGDALEARARGVVVPRPTAKRVGEQWVVIARGSILVTVTELDARANKTTPRLLAKLWAERFGAALVLATTGRRPELRVGRTLSSAVTRPPLIRYGGMVARVRLW